MFVSPISMMNDSCSRKNNQANNYQTNLISKSKADTISFGKSLSFAPVKELSKPIDMYVQNHQAFQNFISKLWFDREKAARLSIPFTENQENGFKKLHDDVMAIINAIPANEKKNVGIIKLKAPDEEQVPGRIAYVEYHVKKDILVVVMQTGAVLDRIFSPAMAFEKGKLSAIVGAWPYKKEGEDWIRACVNFMFFGQKDGKTVLTGYDQKVPLFTDYDGK